MSKTKNAVLSMLLAFAATAALAPAAFAAETPTAGEGADLSSSSVVTVDSEESLRTAIENAAEGDVIALANDIVVNGKAEANTAALTVTVDGVTIDGAGHAIKAGDFPLSGSYGQHLLGVEGCEGVTLKNLKLKGVNEGDSKSKHLLNIYKSSDVKLENVSISGAAGYGLLVNASTVVVTENLTLSNNAWGSMVNVGFGSGISGWTKGSKFDASDALLFGIDAVYADGGDCERAEGQGGIEIILPSGFVKTPSESGMAYRFVKADGDGNIAVDADVEASADGSAVIDIEDAQGEVKDVSVTIDPSKLKGATSLEVKTPIGAVTLDEAALEQVSRADGKVTLAIEETPGLSSAQEDVVQNARAVYGLSLVDESGKAVEFDGGKASVSITLSEGPITGDVATVYHIADDGTRTPCKTSVGFNNTVVFDTPHFSVYAVFFERASDAPGAGDGEGGDKPGDGNTGDDAGNGDKPGNGTDNGDGNNAGGNGSGSGDANAGDSNNGNTGGDNGSDTGDNGNGSVGSGNGSNTGGSHNSDSNGNSGDKGGSSDSGAKKPMANTLPQTGDSVSFGFLGVIASAAAAAIVMIAFGVRTLRR